MNSATFYIEQLGLQAHPEGGFFRETYRSADLLPGPVLAPVFAGSRNYSTSIYFLLSSHERSLFHRIKSDELWHYHAGSTITIYLLMNGGVKTLRVGPGISSGEQFQQVVPANTWFGAKVEETGSFSLCGCTVSPGFDFLDFELANRAQLLKEFPGCEPEIVMLTKP